MGIEETVGVVGVRLVPQFLQNGILTNLESYERHLVCVQ